MSDEYKETCREFFQKADVDQTGGLSKLELAKVVQKCGCKKSIEEINDMFDDIDANNDDAITFEEFWSSYTGKKPEEVAENELRTVFNQVDTDGSGCISREELKKALMKLKIQCDAEASIEVADKNKDGMVNFEEFVENWRKQF